MLSAFYKVTTWLACLDTTSFLTLVGFAIVVSALALLVIASDPK